jgi:hypothetical protein
MKKLLLSMCGLIIASSIINAAPGMNRRLNRTEQAFLYILLQRDATLAESTLKDLNKADMIALTKKCIPPHVSYYGYRQGIEMLQRDGIAPDSEGEKILEVVMQMNGINS